MKCKSLRTEGFTFMEVIIALAIASIALLALIRLHLVSTRAVESARTLSRAAMLADMKMAEILATGYPERAGKTGVEETNNGQLQWTTNVAEVKPTQLNDAELGDLRKVTVNVTWGPGDESKSFEIITYVANRKIQ